MPNPTRRRAFMQNPTPWVTQLLSDVHADLQERVPADWLPKIVKMESHHGKVTAELQEYGCGKYGCVLPTLAKGIVIKVTSDTSEAQFARELAGQLPTPICVAYHLLMDLADVEYQGDPVFLLWREEADSVGKIDEVVGQHAEMAIHKQHEAAKLAFIAIQEKDPSYPQLVRVWRTACREMGKLPELAFVADGLLRAEAEAGIFITDVHGGNLGLVTRNGRKVWAITDPGNVVVSQR